MSATAQPIRLFSPASSPEAEQAAIDVLRSGQIASGAHVPAFESAIAEFVGRPHVVATNDMTSALVLALHLAGVTRGDEVATLAFSCMSSNSAVTRVGATPVWVDIDPATASMAVEDLVRAITPRTKAVMVYHVAGYPAEIEKIAEVCRSRGIALIEDCNNALGARVRGRAVGQWGDFAVFSFYPNRQLNGIEGGAVACPSQDVAAQARRLRRFGIDASTFRDPLGEINPMSDIPEIGWSASPSNLNAAVALAQLPFVPDQLQRTRGNALVLQKALAGHPSITPVVSCAGSDPCHWGFLVIAQGRDKQLARLKTAGVQASRLHHRNDDYSGFQAKRRALPGTDRFMQSVLALPCGWWLAQSDLARIIDLVHSI